MGTTAPSTRSTSSSSGTASRSFTSAFIVTAGDIVRAAIQEDVAAIGISSYNGGHVDFFAEVVEQLRSQGAGDIAVFGGGGGTITYDDARLMKTQGVDQDFFRRDFAEGNGRLRAEALRRSRARRRAIKEPATWRWRGS